MLRAGQIELGLTVRSESTPVRFVLHLTVVALGLGLPGLVEGLKVEDIDTPCEHAANGRLVVISSIHSAGDGRSVVGSTSCLDVRFDTHVSPCHSKGAKLTCGPSGLTVAKANLVCIRAGNLLNVAQSLSHVIKVGVSSIAQLLALPVGEAVGQAM